MTYPIFCVRDIKSGFMSPMVEPNADIAIRNFKLGMKNNQIMSENPKDFDLFKIGAFDTDTGRLSVVDLPELIMEGVDAIGYADRV